MLRSQRSLLHVNVMVAFRFLFLWEAAAEVIAELTLIERTVRRVVRYLAHTFAVDTHGFVRFLRHTEHLAHLRWRRSSAAQASVAKTAESALLSEAILLAQLLEVRMLEGLRRRQPMIMIVNEQFSYDIACFWVLRNQLGQACALLLRKVELHVTRHLLKLIEQLLLGRAEYVMNLVHLVQLVGAREQRCQR